MEFLRYGPDGHVSPGFARCPAGTPLLRGHTIGLSPHWFSPAPGQPGQGRFDADVRTPSTDGTCYLAPTVEGVLLERVIRNLWRPLLSLRQTRAEHALSEATLHDDLVLIDLRHTHYTVHQLELQQITASPPYALTQQLSSRWMQEHASAEGIVYSSRFSAGVECIALWSRAEHKVTWKPTSRIGDDATSLASACLKLGIGLTD